MPSFKPKNNKTIEIDKSSIVTLDNKHEEHSGIFKKNNEYLLPILFKIINVWLYIFIRMYHNRLVS